MDQFKDCPDEILLSFLKDGNQKAFAEIFNRYWKKAHLIAQSKLGHQEEAKDMVQDLFADLWLRRKTLKIINLQAYLHTAIKYKAIDFIKNQLVFQKHSAYYKAYVHGHEDTTMNDVYHAELLDKINAYVDELPEKSQKIFRLNRVEGLSISDIANNLNLTEKAIQYHITKSIKALKVHLKDFIVIIAIQASGLI